MDEATVQNFVTILANVLALDDNIRASATQAFYELQLSDPNTFVAILFTIIANQASSMPRKQACIQAKNFIFKESRKPQSERSLSSETYQYIITCITQTFGQMNMDDAEWTELFLILNRLMIPIILPGLWPEVFTLIWGLLTTNLCYRAIGFFAEYLSFVKEETLSQIPPELIQNLPQLVKLDAEDGKIRSVSITLAFKLILFNPEMASLYPVIQQALLALPDSEIDGALDSFISTFYMNIVDQSINDFFGVCLQIAANQERSDQARIASLEAIIKFIARPSVNQYLVENILIFIQTLASCFITNDREDGVYLTASNLLDEFAELNGQGLLSNAIASLLDQIPPQSLSAFLVYIPSPKFIDSILQFAQQPDETLMLNAFDSLEKMLHNNYKQLLNKKPQAIQSILDILLAWISNGRTEAITPLAELVENFSYYDKSKLHAIIQVLIDIYSKVVLPDSVRCMAAIAKTFPIEMSTNSLGYAMSALELITPDSDDDACHILLMACSTFVKCIPEAQIGEFLQRLIEKVSTIPELTMFVGFRLIAKQMGASFAPFLVHIYPYLHEMASKEIELIVDDSNHRNDDSLLVYFPGNIIIKIKSEQYSEISRALLSIADYARAVGQEFMPYAESAIQDAIHGFGNAYSDDIRISSLSLLSSIAKSNPQFIPQVFEFILKKLLETHEPLASVKEEMMKALKKIIKIEQCPDEIKLQYLTSLPGLLNSALVSMRKENEDNELNSDEYDSYLNLLWSIAKALKFLYGQESLAQQAGAAFIEVSKQLAPFNEEPLLLVKQFSMAVWIDFLIYGPKQLVAQCQPMIQQVLGMANDEDCECRQLALYGFGRIFENVEVPPDQLDSLLAKLYEVCTSEVATENEDFYKGNDSGLSSYGILLKKRIPFGNASLAISKFIEMFPAEDDIDEVQLAYSILFELLCEAGNNQEIVPFVQPICEKLAEGISIESNKNEILEIFSSKMKEGNLPDHVSQFLQQISQ